MDASRVALPVSIDAYTSELDQRGRNQGTKVPRNGSCLVNVLINLGAKHEVQFRA